MTPQLQQSIKLLQMSSQELIEFIDTQLEANPLLNREEGSLSQAEFKASTQDNAIANDGIQSDGELNNLEDSTYDAYGYSAPSVRERSPRHNSFDEDGDSEERFSKDKSLKEYLSEQAGLQIQNIPKRLIASHLIDMLDDSGYLWEDPGYLMKALGCTREMIEETIADLQKLEPAGVFARNLAECLKLQLLDRSEFNQSYERLLKHLDLLAAKDHKTLQKLCDVDEETMQSMIANIRSLNPKPGNAFPGDDSIISPPDVIIRKIGGDYRVEINPDAMPKILINESYYAVISDKIRGKEEKKYLSDSLSDANWVVKALDQRMQSILKVATEIVARQKSFFEKGVEGLKPMVLKDIAEALGIHESTVSRVTSNKYMSTPRGNFEMKFFFTSTIGTAFNENGMSSEAVKYKIKQLIDTENPVKVLSDDDIALVLQKDGIDIARRTIAKYREAMGIGSSVERRKQKKG
jgi:RNA polymerase sigma-54 factor